MAIHSNGITLIFVQLRNKYSLLHHRWDTYFCVKILLNIKTSSMFHFSFCDFCPLGVTAPSISSSSSSFSSPKWSPTSSWLLVSLDGVSGILKHFCVVQTHGSFQFLSSVNFSVSLSLLLSGWIVSLAALKTSVPVGAIMMMNAVCFTAQTAMGVVMLQKVKTEYNTFYMEWK